MKVLLVDDEPIITQGLSLLIDWEKEGFEIAACLANGNEALKFLEEEKVAVVPGTAFGDCGEGFLRISYAYSIDDLKVAIGILKNFVERLRTEK